MSLYSSRKSSGKPSSILKKAPSLKSRLSQISNTPSKVRFVLPESKKVHAILKDYLRKDIIKEYESLVVKIRDSVFTDDDILMLLREATQCISLINRQLRLFVEAILSINWTDKNEAVIKEYQGFIVNLVAAHNSHLDYVVDKLVLKFLPDSSETDWVDATPSEEDSRKLHHVHTLLEQLLKANPLCKNLLKHSINGHFPYFKKSSHMHEHYLHNLLWIIQYEATLRPDIMELIFTKLTILDVNIPREEIERLRTEAEEDDCDLFPMDVDDSRTIVSTVASKAHETAHSLDICLKMIFQYYESECFENDTNELNWRQSKSLYLDSLVAFDKVILPTFQIHHVQFFMFYLCSFHPTISEAFLNYLWNKVGNLNLPSVVRQSAVNYMASFIARAMFIKLSTVKSTLALMSEWLHMYITNQDGLESVNSDVRIHSVFYTVCQALFYIVAFRQRDLFASKKDITFLEGLNMSKIVSSRLNPLRVCQPAVVQNFAAITRNFQLAYCYSIMEHNARNTMPTIYRDEKGAITSCTNQLDLFFPFDPYLLQLSGERIHPHYREYLEVSFEAEEAEIPKPEEMDEFVEQDRSLSKFSYGTSPGFKFNQTPST